ncbi:DUF3221 domain-containing protein [Bacillus thuringiensis]|uniref:DUF3221 domain-containing protein n=1 Tax=Bacillus thuringiensis TaxID=1428 RepID=A0AAW9GP03_BACTU|nr:DUF3221 domain-containing protein [Bacillus thuringiensis]MDY0854361.1 DUF3221 domain-containing protein [Bacillus thuringiensis]MDY4393649.1 DUF3221 domain-containing protein [Bacillus thuringiensis]
MFITKQKLVTVAVTLGCGFTFGLSPASAASNEAPAKRAFISPVEKLKQTLFTGYVVSINNNSMTVIDTPTLEEALLYKENWEDLVNKDKVLIVPVPIGNSYTVKDKLNVKYTISTMSLPPIALSPIIEKVAE